MVSFFDALEYPPDKVIMDLDARRWRESLIFVFPCYELNGDKYRTCRPTHGFFLREFGGRKESSVPERCITVFMISWIIIETC